MSTRIVLISLALALVAAPAALAQEAVSREEAAAAETERRRFVSGGFTFKPRHGGGSDSSTRGSCLHCSEFGDTDVFDYPLYDDCDVNLLQSLFDIDFSYDINAQAAFLQSDLVADPSMNMNVGSLTAAALKITANPFLAKFFPVPRQAHAAMGSAPQFAGKFFGTSRGGPSVGSFIEFEQPFLCTLKPNTSKILAAADCTADLTSLFEQGVLGNFTFGVMDDTTMTITNEFIPPPLSNFELTFKRDHFCKANDLIFVGTNVEAGRALNGTDTSIVEPNGFSLLTITGPFTLAQQVTLKGTRIYKSHYEFGF